MSARTLLIEQLATLDPEVYRVSPNTPDGGTRITTGKAYLTVQRAGAVPASQSSGWGHTLAVYLLVGAEDYATAEDALDIHLPTVVDAIESPRYPISTIDRDVFFAGEDTAGWHGYRITVTAITRTL